MTPTDLPTNIRLDVVSDEYTNILIALEKYKRFCSTGLKTQSRTFFLLQKIRVTSTFLDIV